MGEMWVWVSRREKGNSMTSQMYLTTWLPSSGNRDLKWKGYLCVCMCCISFCWCWPCLFIYSSDSQKVPISPRFDSTPNSYVSLHSTQLPSEAASVDSKVQLKAKRVLFSSELGGQGFSEDEFYPDHSSTNSPTLQSFMEERGNDEVTSDEETGFSVPSLNSPNRSDGAFQAALVVS